MADLNSGLKNMRSFYQEGNTLSYQFRKNQLQALQKVIVKYEDEINKALYFDLKKSKEETWATETGLLMAELKNSIKNLQIGRAHV